MQKLIPAFKRLALRPVSNRGFGIMDRYQEKKQREEFDRQINFFLGKQTFNLGDYKQYTQESLYSMKKGFIKSLFVGDDNVNEAELLEQKKVLDAMHEEELQNPDEVVQNDDLKQEIALVSGSDIDKVNAAITSYRTMAGLHKWVHKLKKNGEPLPKNGEEMQHRFRQEYKPPLDMRYARQKEYNNYVDYMRKKHTQERIAEKRLRSFQKYYGIKAAKKKEKNDKAYI